MGAESPRAKYHRRISMSLAANTKRGPSADSRADEDRLDRLAINTIRTLAIDAVQKANSGHAGTPMAMAPVAYTLWQQFLRLRSRPTRIWPNRDRFVLSCGHASMLLYSLLHLAGVRGTTTAGARSQPRRHQAIPATKQPHAGPSRISPDHRRRDDNRSARPGLRQQRRHGDREPLARRQVQPARTRHCSITTSTCSAATAT